MGKSYGIRPEPAHVGSEFGNGSDPAAKTIMLAMLRRFKSWVIWKLRTILRFRWR